MPTSSSPPGQTHYNQLAGQSTDRLAGISDGIFAVAMTLLVLGLAVPTVDRVHSESDLGGALLALVPSFVTYTMSFLTAGIFWVGRQTQISQLEGSDRNLTWIYLAFLLFVTLLPFSTQLLARFIELRVALVVYWFNIALLGLAHFRERQLRGGKGLLPRHRRGAANDRQAPAPPDLRRSSAVRSARPCCACSAPTSASR